MRVNIKSSLCYKSNFNLSVNLSLVKDNIFFGIMETFNGGLPEKLSLSQIWLWHLLNLAVISNVSLKADYFVSEIVRN